MATLVLQVAGAAVGSVFGPFGAAAGRALGGLAGAAIDRTFLNAGRSSAPLRSVDVTASTEGAPIARAWGRVRLPGQIIWSTRVEAVRTGERRGGKGGGGGTATESVSYFANVALGLCEGPVARIGRIWADGQEIDAGAYHLRLHTGTEDQEPDLLIVAKEGAENAPAYRGLAYVVIERMPLGEFGNRVPQLQFEIIRPVGKLEEQIRAMTLIPGSSEFAYDPLPVERVLGVGASVPENRHTQSGETDLITSLDELAALCPNLTHVSLVVAWFGDDLRAGHCTVAPRVDSATKRTTGAQWSVAGLNRANARMVSLHEGRPAYGGSPSDASVIGAIREMRARGLKVTLYPFLMMDIPEGNDLPDPVSGLAPQPAYPWRGTIRAVGDGTADATDEIAQFFGNAAAADFAVSGTAVSYSGPAEWSWRRCVLHMAALGEAAGGVDAIVIGSEFRDLTRSRDDQAHYPAVAELVALAGEVRALAGPGTKITYASDWTERGSHVLGNDVRFPLDPLWASDERLFAGANACAIPTPDGDWEILQFGRTELVGPSTFRLSHFLRGQYGTEEEASVAKPAGSSFVLLDDAVLPLARGLDALGRPTEWRIAPASRDHADPLSVAVTATPGNAALRPLAPVHLRARREEDGTRIDWIRRDRMNADSWEPIEIPISEAGEAYRVEILNGTEVVRRTDTDEPRFFYSNAAELADFGALQSALAVRVAQLSHVIGLGRFKETILDV